MKKLYEHYEVWFRKYKEKINKDNVALVYVGVSEKKPFPPNINHIIQERIRELELQTSYRDSSVLTH